MVNLKKTLLLGKTSFEESPRNVLRKYILSTDSSRKEWDSSFVSGRVIENIDDNMVILHFQHKSNKKTTETVLLCGWREYDDGSIVLLTLNIEHSKVNVPLDSQRRESLNYIFTPKKHLLILNIAI